MTSSTLHFEHDLNQWHLSEAMQDSSHHGFRVVESDGGAAIVMPTDTSWVQSMTFHGFDADTLRDTAALSRMFTAAWAVAECCRSSMNDMRTAMTSQPASARGGTSAGASGRSATTEGMAGRMCTIVCGPCTINMTM